MNPLEIIEKYSLTVRCLPKETVSCFSYREGDETKNYFNSDGTTSTAKREVVTQVFDLQHFIDTPPPKWSKQSPEQRFATWQKNFPNGRKLLMETKQVKHGGWWYVQESKHTGGTIIFTKHDIFAPTLEEALTMYLNSLGKDFY